MGGACKYFAWTPETILDMAWPNLMLYLATIPVYDEDNEEEGDKKETVIDANTLTQEEAMKLLHLR